MTSVTVATVESVMKVTLYNPYLLFYTVHHFKLSAVALVFDLTIVQFSSPLQSDRLLFDQETFSSTQALLPVTGSDVSLS